MSIENFVDIHRTHYVDVRVCMAETLYDNIDITIGIEMQFIYTHSHKHICMNSQSKRDLSKSKRRHDNENIETLKRNTTYQYKSLRTYKHTDNRISDHLRMKHKQTKIGYMVRVAQFLLCILTYASQY